MGALNEKSSNLSDNDGKPIAVPNYLYMEWGQHDVKVTPSDKLVLKAEFPEGWYIKYRPGDTRHGTYYNPEGYPIATFFVESGLWKPNYSCRKNWDI